MNIFYPLLVVLVVVLFSVGFLFLYSIFWRRKYFKRNDEEFGTIPHKNTGLEAARNYWEMYSSTYQINTREYIDDITWNDIDMDLIFGRINSCQSSAGEVHLYQVLRQIDCSDLQARENIITLFEKDKKLRQNIQADLALLGKKDGYSIYLPAFAANSMKLRHKWLYRFLSIMPLCGFLLIMWYPVAALLTFVGFLSLNFFIVLSFKNFYDDGFTAVRYFAATIGCANKLAKRLKSLDPQRSKDLENAVSSFRSMTGSIVVLHINHFFTELGMMCPLSCFLLPVLSFGKVAEKLSAYREEVYTLNCLVGELDCAASILSYRKSLDQYATPTYHENNNLTFEELIHPLIQKPIANSMNINENLLITGSNASGKSSFLKAIAINCILAQTINTCTAKSFALKAGYIASSMAVSDNIIAKESYFIAEIKSMKRLLELAEMDFSYFFIDEILKGTNTVERIAAASEIIAYLSTKNCLCFAATHDIELTNILEHRCRNIHFKETVNENGVYFDYLVQNGPSTTRNAICLLESMGFPIEVYKNAHLRALEFDDKGIWTKKR